jgi:hypothetical protein
LRNRAQAKEQDIKHLMQEARELEDYDGIHLLQVQNFLWALHTIPLASGCALELYMDIHVSTAAGCTML